MFKRKKKDTPEFEIEDGHLFTRAVQSKIIKLKAEKEKADNDFLRAVFCPFVSGAIANRYGSQNFGDFYCIDGYPSTVYKDRFPSLVTFTNSRGTKDERSVPDEIRDTQGERWIIKTEVKKICGCFDTVNYECMLMKKEK